MRGFPNLWIVTLDAPAAQADAIADVLGEGAVSQAVMAGGDVALASVARVKLEAIFDGEPAMAGIKMRLAIFAAVAGIALPEPVLRPAPKLDWLKKVAEDFPPLQIGRWCVHGAYHRKAVPNRLLALQIDATSAFGTGGHPSTQGCLLMLHKMLKSGFRPRRVLDIGCGSGILSMACVKSARGHAVAVDLDPVCVDIAARNTRVNGTGGRIQVRRSRGYAAPVVRRGAPYDMILTNLFTEPLCQMARDVRAHLRPGGIAILAGILSYDAKRVIAAHRMQGLSLIEHRKNGDWSILAFRR